jgi:SAM-dependent methyltransferase
MRKGWFKIPGVQDGDRALEEQLRGLEPMLAAVEDKVVLDLGCAEGLIAREVLARGARKVWGLDCNPESIAVAGKLGLDPHRAHFAVHNANDIGADEEACLHSDIVLGLAIFHKLHRPAESLMAWSRFARDLLVLRLPGGSKGAFVAKHSKAPCDVGAVLPQQGFYLERTLSGPRDELVQYWRRAAA